MQTDPYAELNQLMQEVDGGSRTHVMLGTVKQAEPLLVDVGGTDQEAGRFYLCDRLRNGHLEAVTLQGGRGGFSANGGTHAVTLDPGTLSLSAAELRQDGPVLRAGDQVLLLTEDFQTFFLIDKVVHL